MRTKIELQRKGERSYFLDARGYVCPYPQLLTLRALQTLSSGEILEVLLDNPPSVKDIPVAIENRGYGAPKVENVDKGTWKLVVQIAK
jgi:tRNA 2-thiouridine synthesizing protein A